MASLANHLARAQQARTSFWGQYGQAAIKKNILFSHLDEDQRQTVIDAMFAVDKAAGDYVINQVRAHAAPSPPSPSPSPSPSPFPASAHRYDRVFSRLYS